MGASQRRRRDRSRAAHWSKARARAPGARLATGASHAMTSPVPHASDEAVRSLRRTLRPRDLILIVIGTVIGSGIFLVPGPVLRQTGGDVRIALAVWVFAGGLSLLGALTFAEMGAAKPDAGGLYLYIRDAFGPLPAFLYGWTSFFVLGAGSVATLAVAFTRYLQQFVTVSPMVARLVAVLVIEIGRASCRE